MRRLTWNPRKFSLVLFSDELSKSPGDPQVCWLPLVGEPGPRSSNTLLEERAMSWGLGAGSKVQSMC